MPAKPGDRITVYSTVVGGKERDGEVVAARGRDGGPPYLVRWDDTGAESLLFPGSDTVVRSSGSTDRVASEA